MYIMCIWNVEFNVLGFFLFALKRPENNARKMNKTKFILTKIRIHRNKGVGLMEHWWSTDGALTLEHSACTAFLIFKIYWNCENVKTVLINTLILYIFIFYFSRYRHLIHLLTQKFRNGRTTKFSIDQSKDSLQQEFGRKQKYITHGIHSYIGEISPMF